MRELEPPFELDLEGRKIVIAEHEIGANRVFHVDFKGWKKLLVITVGVGLRDQKFWTSIPQGRQAETEQIGKLIAEYIRAKKKLYVLLQRTKGNKGRIYPVEAIGKSGEGL
ncbi:hypothetical protein [Pedobacter psychroterrae]|uniref:Uncharacterized protein n=1 Tax=Pedobacter psychroterrae TaxID=2530453 RepID=A0A4V2MLC3_9SPHI|nr:hypothetical protein [Pedobacter psychroterrae]TCD01407.1 hypothetical protein EZ437_11720 [Pedobacter psychroterrae]